MRFVFSVLVILFSFTMQSFAGIQEAKEAYSQKDYVRALPLLEAAALSGDVEGQVLLAQLLINGKAGKKDLIEAAYWYRRAAEQDPGFGPIVAHAQFNLAAMMFSGMGVTRDIEKAVSMYERSARNGNVEAQRTLAGLYYNGVDGKKDLENAFKWALVAAANGDQRALQAARFMAARVSPEKVKKATLLAKSEFPKLTYPDVGPKVAVMTEKGVLNTPISPSAGFNKELEALYRSPITRDDGITRQLETELLGLTPPYIFELARRKFAASKELGVTYFWLAKLRAGYDASRCTDKTAARGIPQWHAILADVIEYIRANPDVSITGKKEALKLDLQFSTDPSPGWICFFGIEASKAAHANRSFTKWLKPESEWASLRETNRNQMKQAIGR